jgi:hypothetical protein
VVEWEGKGAEIYKLRLNFVIPGDSQGTVNVLGDDSNGRCEKRNSYERQ